MGIEVMRACWEVVYPKPWDEKTFLWLECAQGHFQEKEKHSSCMGEGWMVLRNFAAPEMPVPGAREGKGKRDARGMESRGMGQD